MTYHSSDVTIALEVFNNLLFVGWFDTGEALWSAGGSELFIFGEIIEFFSGVGLSVGFFISTEDTDLLADSDGSVLKVILGWTLIFGHIQTQIRDWKGGKIVLYIESLPCYHQWS